jgi:hypothetical protein
MPGKYVSGRELADAGMAELVELDELHLISLNGEAAEKNSKLANSRDEAAKPLRPAKVPARRRSRKR